MLCDIYINKLGNIFPKDYAWDWLRAKAKSWVATEEFIKSLPEPDGHDHIKDLADTIVSSDPVLTHLLIRKWLIGFAGSMTGRIYNENVLVLVGKQGIGKTIWVRGLLPEKWKEYMLVRNINPDNKDDLIALCENFIIYNDEMDNVLNDKASVESFKVMTSLDRVTVRRPYDRVPTESQRRASFAGAINEVAFLKDTTGNRRFFIIDAEKIDYKHKIDMMKVYRQALDAYLEGEHHYLSPAERDILDKHNQLFHVLSIEDEMIDKYMEIGDEELMRASEIILEINRSEQKDILKPNFVNQFGKYLRRKGFKQVSGRKDGSPSRLNQFSWKKEELDIDTNTVI